MLKVNRDDKRPLWQQLLDQAIDHINNGVWKPGQLLTPTRELAQQLGVSRSTIQIVYDELLTRGYTVTSGRGGTRVNDWIQINDKYAPSLDPPQLPELPLLVEQSQHWFRSKDNQGSVIDFSPYQPFRYAIVKSVAQIVFECLFPIQCFFLVLRGCLWL